MDAALQGVSQPGAPPPAHSTPLLPPAAPTLASDSTEEAKRHGSEEAPVSSPVSRRSQASLTRVLEEALPLFIARKQAFHLLLKQVGPP